MVEKFDRVLVKEVTVDGHLFSFRLHFFYIDVVFSILFLITISSMIFQKKIYEIATENHDMQVSFTSLHDKC